MRRARRAIGLTCPRPHCRGHVTLESADHDEARGFFALTCDLCARRLSEVPGHPIDAYLATLESDRMLEGESARHGYVSADYLRTCAVPGDLLLRARHARIALYCWTVDDRLALPR